MRLLARRRDRAVSGFFAYACPEPVGFSAAILRPEGAVYDSTLHEFILPYDAVRLADSPDETLLEFLQSSYEAAARLGGWDRRGLERQGLGTFDMSLRRLHG